MKVGKLTIEDLKDLVLNNIKVSNKNILSSGEIGNDCSAIKVDNKIIYLSSDPITGSSNNLGKLAININCNDIATEGIQPLGIMLTILAPAGTTREEIAQIVKEAQKEAEKTNVSIIGGHTEITNSVNKIVVSATSIGVGETKDFKNKNNVVPGDRIVITKGVGIEGTGIIAFEKEEEILTQLGKNILDEAKLLLDKTSVVKDGLVANKYAKGMHDVTEGGILGAVWETSSLYNLGAEIDYKKIKIHKSTQEICKYFSIDPLKLISSGTMLIIVSQENVHNLIEDLKKNNIPAFDIGQLTKNPEKILKFDNKVEVIPSPESDDLYKVV